MAAGASAQMQVTFEDIAISFSQEEWEYLDEEQKELYREVMKENYQTLISLGTGSLTFTPKIISHIERGEEPYIRREPGSEERETWKNSCSADHQIQHEWKREKNQGENLVEMEQIQTHSENVCENISQGTEKINTKNYKQESKKQRDPTDVSRDGVRKCERNDRDLSYIPEDQRHLAEGPFQIKNSDKVTSKFHHGKRKGKTHKKELQLLKRDPKNVNPSTATECNKSFPRLSALKRHKIIHTGHKPFTCTDCNKTFTRHSALKNHQLIHTGYKPFTCTECNKTFTRHSALKKHQVIHTGHKPFTCTECNKTFTWHSALKNHQVIHTGYKPYTCIECNKSFTRLSNLKFHERIHTGDKPYTWQKPFTCTECKKHFTHLSYLKRHKIIHTGHKPFMCTECNKIFTQFSNLKFHKKIHMGAKPYTL
uniref:Zinc finger protein 347-like n=1 Tax=Geotrypetes seraphini TaxID=260995 RepID=A0A6P8Q1R6_GEOSA|nr:zinc finger protein 347-like [Geotrypetes seraphini]